MVNEGDSRDDPGCRKGCSDFCEEIRGCCGSVKNFDCGACCKDYFSFAALQRKLPILKWGPKYRLHHLQGDLIAGLTVGLTVIPQGLAYAVIAELPPQYGLYSAFMGCFIYCFMGTSKDITLGPTAIMSLMTAAFGGSPLPDDPSICVVMTLFCGIAQFLMGVLNIGFLVDFISFPVISGFTTAAAITIACGQIKKWLGLKHIPREFIHQMIETFAHIKDTVIGDLVLGLVVMIILKLMKKMKEIKWNIDSNTGLAKRAACKTLWLFGTARNALVILLASVLAGALEHAGYEWFTMTGSITPGLPKWEAPKFHIQGNFTDGNTTTVIDWGPSEIFGKIGAGLAIVPIIGLVETIAIGKAFARKNKYNIDANQELLAIGISNVVGCFVQSYPVTGSFSRTAVNSQSGVMTPAGGIFTGGLVLLALGLLTQYFYFIPQAALAGLIIVAVLDMVDFSVVRRLWAVKRVDVIPWLATFIFSFILGIEYGIMVGIGVSLLLLLYPWARPSVKVDSRGTKIVQLDAGLRFPGVEYLKQRVLEESQEDGTYQNVILDCRHISGIDYTAVQGFVQLISDFSLYNVRLVLSHMQPDVLAVMEKANVRNLRLAEDNEEALRLIAAGGKEEEAGLLSIDEKQLENGKDQMDTSPV